MFIDNNIQEFIMKLRVAALVLPLVLVCSASFSAATTPTTSQNILSFQQALDVIEKAGYTNLHKIELERNYYVVEAQDAQGKKIEFKLDAMTGSITPILHAKQTKTKHKHVKHTKNTKQ